MSTVRRLAMAALAITYLHLVFGGLVRITGSGMGCGDSWPNCNGSWMPDLSSPHTVIELTHRLLATLVILSVAALAYVAFRRRAEPGVGGSSGVLGPAKTALALVIAVALLGMVTVKLGNPPWATVAHWAVALTLLAVIAVCAIRAGALGGAAASARGGTPRAARTLGAGAGMAFLAVVLGGLVAKWPGASFACGSFPLCGPLPGAPAAATHLQMTHRVVAYLLFFHVIAIATALSRRAEAAPVKRAAKVAALLVLLQLGLGAAMVMAQLPAALRSAHQAVGIGIWLTLFVGTYLARVAATADVQP
jgi:cytochrome c oxidase assembly protein subunit 15